MTNPERISDELRPQTRHDLANLDAFIKAARWNAVSEGGADDFRRNYGTRLIDALEALARRSPPAQERMVLDAPAREAGGETKLIDDIINGTAPMSKWMGSVDYSTYDGFEEYLKTQLREKLDLKVRLDKKRHESAEDESLATFVDGGSGALEAALATYRTVRERVAAASPAEPAAHSLQTLAPASDAVKPANDGSAK